MSLNEKEENIIIKENIMNQDNNKFLNNYEKYQFQMNEINDLRNKDLDNNSIKSFNEDINSVSSINQDLINDINKEKKNMDILVKKLIDIDKEGKFELTNIVKDISEKISDLYSYLIDTINDQDKEKLKLHLELKKALRENDELKEQVNFLRNEVLKIEEVIGIEHQEINFDSTNDN